MAINEPPPWTSGPVGGVYLTGSTTANNVVSQPIWSWTDKTEELEQAQADLDVAHGKVDGAMTQIHAFQSELIRALHNDTKKRKALLSLGVVLTDLLSDKAISQDDYDMLMDMIKKGIDPID